MLSIVAGIGIGLIILVAVFVTSMRAENNKTPKNYYDENKHETMPGQDTTSAD